MGKGSLQSERFMQKDMVLPWSERLKEWWTTKVVMMIEVNYRMWNKLKVKKIDKNKAGRVKQEIDSNT